MRSNFQLRGLGGRCTGLDVKGQVRDSKRSQHYWGLSFGEHATSVFLCSKIPSHSLFLSHSSHFNFQALQRLCFLAFCYVFCIGLNSQYQFLFFELKHLHHLFSPTCCSLSISFVLIPSLSLCLLFFTFLVACLFYLCVFRHHYLVCLLPPACYLSIEFAHVLSSLYYMLTSTCLLHICLFCHCYLATLFVS